MGHIVHQSIYQLVDFNETRKINEPFIVLSRRESESAQRSVEISVLRIGTLNLVEAGDDDDVSLDAPLPMIGLEPSISTVQLIGSEIGIVVTRLFDGPLDEVVTEAGCVPFMGLGEGSGLTPESDVAQEFREPLYGETSRDDVIDCTVSEFLSTESSEMLSLSTSILPFVPQ